MSKTIYRQAERVFAAWKNGGGETAEILCVPPAAGYDGFNWRISTARVAQSGPFSRFVGVSRNLTVLEGGEMTLTIEGAAPVRLGPESGPHAFSGAAPCEAELHGAPLLDLNVMVRSPYSCEVLRRGAAVPSASEARARYLFALHDLPEFDLGKFDLLDMEAIPEPQGAAVPAGALLIVIRD